MARTDFFQDAARLNVDEARAELEAQAQRYRDCAVAKWARADKAELDEKQEDEGFYREQAEYHQGRANGIREALRVFAERGI